MGRVKTLYNFNSICYDLVDHPWEGNMDDSKEKLLKKAMAIHGRIEPTCTRRTLEECFTTEDSKLIFWFNDETGNTKVLVQEQSPRRR